VVSITFTLAFVVLNLLDDMAGKPKWGNLYSYMSWLWKTKKKRLEGWDKKRIFLYSITKKKYWYVLIYDVDQPNTKRNHANDPLEVLIGPIIRARENKLKKALNGLVQNI